MWCFWRIFSNQWERFWINDCDASIDRNCRIFAHDVHHVVPNANRIFVCAGRILGVYIQYKSYRRIPALIYGFLVWVLPFLIRFFIFPLQISFPILFDSTSPIIITLFTAVFSILYFKNVHSSYLREGFLIGAIWLVINIVIDFLMFMTGPLIITTSYYVMEKGIIYLRFWTC